MASRDSLDAIPLIPRRVLFGNPVRAQPRVSPDGKRLTYLAPDEGVMNVWLAGEAGEPDRAITRDRARGIQTCFWGQDSARVLYLQDSAGDENWHLFSVDPRAEVARDLTPFLGIQGLPLDAVPEKPGEMLVSMNLRDRTVHDVHRLDLETGALRLDTENPGNVVGWLADRELQVRGALARTAEGGCDLQVRESSGAAWRKLLSWSPDDEMCGAYGFTPDGTGLYLHDSRGANAQRLVELDVASGKERVLAEDPRFDVGAAIFAPVTRKLQAVSFARQRQEWTVIDEAFRPRWERVQAAALGREAVLASRSRDDRTWIVAFLSDRAQASYYRQDGATGELVHLFDAQPELDSYRLAPMEPVAFAARDGLGLEGYLTLPEGGPATGLPMVLLVHGGPWARDVWGFDPEAQLLANRGYACLQVNYRGSTGYGRDFLDAGDREWGARMQDDLVDAVRWAVDRGLADPGRVAVMGGSYGGYAALAGAAFNSEVFACAVSMVGPSSLVTLIESIPPYWKPMIRTFDRRVGNVETEQEFLLSRSPLTHVDGMQIPLLIAQGANDPRVKKAESEQIVAALRARGKEVEYLLYEDEGHGLVRPENRLGYYAAVERFLSRHLGGRAED